MFFDEGSGRIAQLIVDDQAEDAKRDRVVLPHARVSEDPERAGAKPFSIVRDWTYLNSDLAAVAYLTERRQDDVERQPTGVWLVDGTWVWTQPGRPVRLGAFVAGRGLSYQHLTPEMLGRPEWARLQEGFEGQFRGLYVWQRRVSGEYSSGVERVRGTAELVAKDDPDAGVVFLDGPGRSGDDGNGSAADHLVHLGRREPCTLVFPAPVESVEDLDPPREAEDVDGPDGPMIDSQILGERLVLRLVTPGRTRHETTLRVTLSSEVTYYIRVMDALQAGQPADTNEVLPEIQSASETDGVVNLQAAGPPLVDIPAPGWAAGTNPLGSEFLGFEMVSRTACRKASFKAWRILSLHRAFEKSVRRTMTTSASGKAPCWP